jgi:hypothetical protein
MSVKLGDRIPVDEEIVHHVELDGVGVVEVTHEVMIWGDWLRDPRCVSRSPQWAAFPLGGLAVVFRLFG